jgi:hypothetical protein
MTDTNPATEAAESPSGPPGPGDQPETPPEPAQADHDDHDAADAASEASPNSEAARYRTRLRETEAERDTLAERLAGYQRGECERAVADLLDHPGDLWSIGQADPTQFYDAAGELQEAELRAACGGLLEERPRLAKADPPKQWGQVSAGPPPVERGPSWADVITPR